MTGKPEQDDEIKERPRVFMGRDRYQAFMMEVATIEGAACSPGKAAAELRCSRQFIHKLVKQGKLRAWIYYDTPGAKRADYVYIPFVDIADYAKKHGRGQPEDFQEIGDDFG